MNDPQKPKSLLGFPVIYSDKVPALGGKGDLVLLNPFSAYRVRRPAETLALADVPVRFSWTERGVPMAVLADRCDGLLICGLQSMLPSLPQPTVSEANRIFTQEFIIALSNAIRALPQTSTL